METKKNIDVSHIWHQPSDRWIYIERQDDGKIGLNYMQGDERDFFLERFCVPDKDLSAFFNQVNNKTLHPMLAKLKKKYGEIEFINEMIWVYFFIHSLGITEKEKENKLCFYGKH